MRWNSERIFYTCLAAVAALIIAAAVGAAAGMFMSNCDSTGFSVFIAGVLSVVLWLISTAFIWRETVAERAQRIAASSGSAIACPTCGHNLTGLRETRCPECDTQFTLDELVASLPNNKVEIE